MSLTLIAAALLAAQAQAAEPGWTALTHDTFGNYFLDPTSVRRDGAIIRFTMRAVANTPMADGTATIVSRQALDCSRRTMTTLGGELYGTTGALLQGGEVPLADLVAEPINPGSAQDDARAQLCGLDAA